MKAGRVIALILSLAMLFALPGCFAGGTENEGASAQGTSADANSAYVIDASGNELKIPESGDISIASVYAVAVPFLVALGLSDQVIAINYKSKFWPEQVEAFEKAGSVGRGIIDLELLAEYSPDLLIHRSNDERAAEAVSKLGIPVMSIRAENIDEIMSTLDLIGRYCHAESRAEEVKNWITGKFDRIAEIVSRIPEEERFTAIVMGGELGVVAGGEMLQSWMLERAGAISLTSKIGGINNRDGELATAWTNIGVERIFEMDPDVIFCTSSAALDYTVFEILRNPVWGDVGAVKNDRVAIIPAKFDSWDLPGVSCTIGTMWMVRMMYPDYLSAEELQAEIDEYYTFMFGHTVEDKAIGYLSEIGNVSDAVEADVGKDGVPVFSISVQGTAVTSDMMTSYPVYEVETTSTNTYGTATTRVYVGYAISDILDAAGITGPFSVLTAIAGDGYAVSVDKEVAMQPTTMIAISEDGKLFKAGPWFAPCSSIGSPDYVRDVAGIVLE